MHLKKKLPEKYQSLNPYKSIGEELRYEWNNIIKDFKDLDNSYPSYIGSHSLVVISSDSVEYNFLNLISLLRKINIECGSTFRSIKLKNKNDMLSGSDLKNVLIDIFDATEIKYDIK